MPALCWALAISQLFAQKTLPQSVSRTSANWSHSMIKMLGAAGYEIPEDWAQPNAKVGVNARNSELQLDSTVTFTNYAVSDSTPIFRTTHAHPLSDSEVQIEWYFENNDWQPLNRNTVITDDLGRLVETMSEAFDPSAQAYTLDSRLEIFPRGDSPDLVDSVFVYAWDANLNVWQRLMSILNSFDDEGRIAESLTTIDVFGQPLQFKDVHVYDVNGDNTLIESYLVDSGFEIPANQVVMEYENHLLKLATSLEFDGFEFLPQSQNAYTYTAFAQDSIVTSFEWDAAANDWANTQTVIYDYDDLQRMSLRETRYYEVGGGESREQLVYSYLEDELLALEETYIWDGGGSYFLSDRKYYYYNGGQPSSVNNPLPVNALRMFPNPTTQYLQVALEENGPVQVFDQTGRMVLQHDGQAGTVILDVSALPAGIYMVYAVSTDKYYAGKLVKQ